MSWWDASAVTAVRVAAVYSVPMKATTTLALIRYDNRLDRGSKSDALFKAPIALGQWSNQLPSIPTTGLIASIRPVFFPGVNKPSALPPKVPTDRHIMLPDHITEARKFRDYVEPLIALLFPEHAELTMDSIGMAIKYHKLPEKPWPLTIGGFPLLIAQTSRTSLERKSVMPQLNAVSSNSPVHLLGEITGPLHRAGFDYVLDTIHSCWKYTNYLDLDNLAWVLYSSRAGKIFIVLKDVGTVGESWQYMPNAIANIPVGYVHLPELCLPEHKDEHQAPGANLPFSGSNSPSGGAPFATPPPLPAPPAQAPFEMLQPPMVFLWNTNFQETMDGLPIITAAHLEGDANVDPARWTLYSWDHFSADAKDDIFDEDSMCERPVRTPDGRTYGLFQYQLKKGPAAGLIVSRLAPQNVGGGIEGANAVEQNGGGEALLNVDNFINLDVDMDFDAFLGDV